MTEVRRSSAVIRRRTAARCPLSVTLMSGHPGAALTVVRANYAALAIGDVPTLLSLSDPDIDIYQSDLVPWGGPRHGHAGLLAFLTAVSAHLDSHVEPEEMFVAGDHVVQVGRTRGTARTTGKAFDAAEVHVWTVRDGLVTKFEAHVDTDELRRALSTDT